MERFIADPNFREETARRPDDLAQRVRALWDADCTHQDPLVTQYQQYLGKSTDRRAEKRESATPSHPAFRAWRQRQILRCRSELGSAHGQAIVHHPVAFELNKGCSVGCWFCGVSAPKLGEVWDYAQNRDIWLQTLEVFKTLLGSAAGQSVLYWATDPFDNPDYELFCRDFHHLFGVFPPTTTALAARYPERARGLLAQSRAAGCRSNRFSVLSLGQLRKIHDHFSDTDLLDVDLVLQNKGSLLKKSKSGRARAQGEGDYTIACVSGFLLNMTEGSLRLISPCRASDRFPDGFRTHAVALFRDPIELETAARRMMNEHMPTRICKDQVLKFRGDLRLTERGLENEHAVHELPNRALAQLIDSGCHTAADIALKLEPDQALESTFFQIHQLFCSGVLGSEPE